VGLPSAAFWRLSDACSPLPVPNVPAAVTGRGAQVLQPLMFSWHGLLGRLTISASPPEKTPSLHWPAGMLESFCSFAAMPPCEVHLSRKSALPTHTRMAHTVPASRPWQPRGGLLVTAENVKMLAIRESIFYTKYMSKSNKVKITANKGISLLSNQLLFTLQVVRIIFNN
jgi:hypothetical protein